MYDELNSNESLLFIITCNILHSVNNKIPCDNFVRTSKFFSFFLSFAQCVDEIFVIKVTGF